MKSGETSFQESSPHGVPENMCDCLANRLWQHVWNAVHQGSSCRHSLPPMYQNSRLLKKSRCSVQAIVSIEFRHHESFLLVLQMVGTFWGCGSLSRLLVLPIQVWRLLMEKTEVNRNLSSTFFLSRATFYSTCLSYSFSHPLLPRTRNTTTLLSRTSMIRYNSH